MAIIEIEGPADAFLGTDQYVVFNRKNPTWAGACQEAAELLNKIRFALETEALTTVQTPIIVWRSRPMLTSGADLSTDETYYNVRFVLRTIPDIEYNEVNRSDGDN